MAAVTHGGGVFAVARQHGWNWRDVLDFSASINPLGPSPRVAPAICRAMERIAHYPDTEAVRLRNELAATWNLNAEMIVPGNGATELLFFVARLFRSVPVTLALPVFSEFHRAFPEALFASLTDPATWPSEGLLVVTRPANPTGWTVPLQTLESYLEHSAATVLVDESFIDFAGLLSSAILIENTTRLIVLRSLTKFYAIPGLRLGALIGDKQVLRSWKDQREPWQVNVLAEEAGLAAIADTEHSARSLQFVRNERTWLTSQIPSRLRPLASDANFICVPLDFSAAPLCNHLLARKILVRNCSGWPGVDGEAIRIAVRTRYENQQLLNAWRDFS